jgi:DNA-binding transcriptional MerR regulator
MISQEIKDKVRKAIQKVTRVDIQEKTRRYEIIESRMIYYKILRDKGFTLQEIGDSLEKNHATVLHSLKVFDDIVGIDKDLKRKYYEVVNQLSDLKIKKYVTKDEYAVEFAEWLLKETDFGILDMNKLLENFKKEVGYECT